MLSTIKRIFVYLILIISHTNISAQTTGPSQPEVQSFQPVTITNLVDPSSGEFQYNIPLFTIGNYPINVNYNSQVGMENEASIVGLGFNLNCGAITRQVRGLPDDFSGDVITKKVNMKPNIIVGMDLGKSIELIGISKLKKPANNYGLNISSSSGFFYNNYSGWGIENRVGAGFHGNLCGLSGNAGIGITSNSQHGTSVNPYCGLSYEYKKDDDKPNNKNERYKYEFKAMKNKSASLGYDFNSSTYTPKMDFPFSTVSMDFSVKVGYAGAYIEVGGDFRGYSVTQKLRTNELANPAYGFMFAEMGKNDQSALMDFNRENDGIMTEDKPNLPFTYATPDVYSVAGQGIGGVFEVKRNNVFIGFDPKTSSMSNSGGAELELAYGVGTHLGAEVRYGYVKNTTSKWEADSNRLLNNIDFMDVKSSSNLNKATAEQTYFKNPNDVMFNRNPVFNFSGFKPIAPTLNDFSDFGGATNMASVAVSGVSTAIMPADNRFVNQLRDNRLDVIYYLNSKEASQFGIQKQLPNYVINNFNSNSLTLLPRIDSNRKAHHLSEMICLKADGTKYVFNVPAYNNVKREISYSVNDQDVIDLETFYIPNLSTVENANKGKDDFISVTETPAFAHSFLLGAVLSANYVDVDDNGPTTNDLGDYVKFNYARVYDSYYWRSNNSLTKASADEGNLADPKDGKAFFSEGTKEIWNIHSIESKKEVSRFYYSKRIDAFDLKNPTQALMRLDSIFVFSRPELLNTNPKPFKKIYFDYNSPTPLCKGIYNDASKSKLTLNSIYFKNGTSNKGKYSAYKFEYSAFNPEYNTLAIDRWGGYKPNTGNTGSIALDNKYFPFVNQETRTLDNKYASAWLLNRINLPSGGTIGIEYEAHDYAYVQNKKAMYMTQVIGITNTRPSSLSAMQNMLYSNSLVSNNYLIFKLKSPISGTVGSAAADWMVNQQYFTDNLDIKSGAIVGSANSNLYGKFRVNLKPELGFDGEDIPVFLNASESGALNFGGNYEYGFVKISETDTGNVGANDANQISKTAWQFVKHSYSQILFGGNANGTLSGTETINQIVNMLIPMGSVVETIMQTRPDKQLRDLHVAQSVQLEKSYLRLYVPDGYKIGGNGARVKNIQIQDNWQNMAGAPAADSNYKIAYDYTKTADEKIISSGVASYEPGIGGEENPWKQPVFFTEKNILMPDDNNVMMTPYGESLFPGANIIYSEVKTTQNPISATNQIGTGYTKNEYYTFYDFPCKVENTDIERVRKPKVNFKLLNNISNDYMATTQGYVVITNDMHGKPKSESTFNERNQPLSSKSYQYKTDSNKELESHVKSISPSGAIDNNNLLGVETQLYGDARRFYTESYSGSVHGNLDVQIWGIVPTVAPSILPDFAFEKKAYSSFTLCKHVRQQGILESVKVEDKGSTITTKNELWDAKTGAVLLTSTTNEFKDPVYNFTYPAHWAYSGMGMASDNISASIITSSDPFTDFDFTSKLHIGDVIGVSDGTTFKKNIVTSLSPPFVNNLYISNSNQAVTGLVFAKVIASGKKNLPTTTIGNLTSLVNPIQGNQLVISGSTKIVSDDAIEYSNAVAKDCICKPNPKDPPSLLETFSLKNLAPWHPLSTYKFVDDRTQTNPNPNIRKDGFVTNFMPFWNTNSWTRSSSSNWQSIEKVSFVDSKLNPIESVNPLNIYSSVQPSNFSGLVNATTTNSEYQENFYDSFEDAVHECNTNHYSINFNNSGNNAVIDNTTAHTGNFSMKTGKDIYAQLYPGDYGRDVLCKSKLTLKTGKKYIISAWVKETVAENTVLDYNNAQIMVAFSAAPNNGIICKPAGQIIDGWQRIEQEFTVPISNTNFTLKFSAKTNFDDIRIFPVDANMKSYVYNYKDYSLMAILDENNFATFYEYDNEKQLKRVKKETEKGVVTIQEINFGSSKKQ